MTIANRLDTLTRMVDAASPETGNVTITLTDDRFGLYCLPVMIALPWAVGVLFIDREPLTGDGWEALTQAERWRRNVEQYEAARCKPEPIIDADLLHRLLDAYGCWIAGVHHPDPPAWVRQRVDKRTA